MSSDSPTKPHTLVCPLPGEGGVVGGLYSKRCLKVSEDLYWENNEPKWMGVYKVFVYPKMFADMPTEDVQKAIIAHATARVTFV